MNANELKTHADLWTSDAGRYRLILSNGVDLADGAVVFDAVSGGPLVIDVSAAVYTAICRNMLAAGVKTISAGEAANYGEEALSRILRGPGTASPARGEDEVS